MYRYLLLAFALFQTLLSYAQKTYDYPVTPKDSVIDIYFDSAIYDPYQWMENPDDPRLAAWLDAQKKITRRQENSHTKEWSLKAQIGTMYRNIKRETHDGYIKAKDEDKSKYEFKYDYKRLDRSADLLYRPRGAGNYRMLMKMKDFRRDKSDNPFFSHRSIDEEHNLAAIEVSHNGSDWREAYFFDLKTGKQLSDTLLYLRAGSKIIWHNGGVYYDRYDKPEQGKELLNKPTGQALYYHKIGTSQAEDRMLFQNPDTSGTNSFAYFKMDSSKLFFYHFYKTQGETYKALSYASLNNTGSFYLNNFLVYPNNDSIRFYVEELFGDTVIINTNWNAPNGHVMAADITKMNELFSMVPQYDVSLREVNRLGKDKIACIYRNDGKFLVLIFNLKGELLKSIPFPEGKKVNRFYEYNEDAEYTDFSVSSFFHPDLWYQLSLKDLTFKPSMAVSVPYDVDKIETRYIKYTSKDGTEVPMYITCLKETKLNGKNPTLLYGYGGYGITVEPHFNESQALWLAHGGILAIPNIRGGGAEGLNWGKQGRRLNKQNAINDFISAAEYLIREKYTNPEKLAINGKSHGGLLVAAAITQRPELFKAAVAEAGPYDMLRFENYTIGSVNTSINEFGNTSNPEDFNVLKRYSPLHNIKDGVKYPNVLLMTGDTDDRVPPLHAYKFLSTLQERGSPGSLYHLYIIPGAGHGGALTPEDWTSKLLYKYYFLFEQLDLKFW